MYFTAGETRNLLRQVMNTTTSPIRRKLLQETLDELAEFEKIWSSRVDQIAGGIRADLVKLTEVEATMAGLNAMPPEELCPQFQKHLERLEEVVTDIDVLIDPRGKYIDPEYTRGKVRKFVKDFEELKFRLETMKRDLDQAQQDKLAAQEEARQLRKGGARRG